MTAAGPAGGLVLFHHAHEVSETLHDGDVDVRHREVIKQVVDVNGLRLLLRIKLRLLLRGLVPAIHVLVSTVCGCLHELRVLFLFCRPLRGVPHHRRPNARPPAPPSTGTWPKQRGRAWPTCPAGCAIWRWRCRATQTAQHVCLGRKIGIFYLQFYILVTGCSIRIRLLSATHKNRFQKSFFLESSFSILPPMK